MWRWRVEIQFRWLKSELGLGHLPSRSLHGIEAYFLLMLIVWTILLLLKALVLDDRTPELFLAFLRDSWAAVVEAVALEVLHLRDA